MKTAAYLRLSLLIPILVWGVCLLILIVASASPLNGSAFSKLTTITDLIFLFFAFYVFGIIIWFFPYLLLSVILLFLSFRVQARAAMKAFALSPIAMTILTIAVLDLMVMGTSGDGTILPNSLMMDHDSISFNILVLAFSLTWGYLCVGIGLGIYRLLQRSRTISDEEDIDSAPRLINQYE
jgi:hypothetical protein